MALTQSDLDRLDAAIATAELEVEFGDGRRVRYRSVAELTAARDHVAGVLRTAAAAAASAGSGGARSAYRFMPIHSREG